MPSKIDLSAAWEDMFDRLSSNGKDLVLDVDPRLLDAQVAPGDQGAPEWTAAYSGRDDVMILGFGSEARVVNLNGAEFTEEELTFLQGFDWSWDLDTFSELADLPDQVMPFGELYVQSREAFGADQGQDFFDRLMNVEISYMAYGGDVRSEQFGPGLFRFSGVPGAFFADPDRASSFVDAFAAGLTDRSSS